MSSKTRVKGTGKTNRLVEKIEEKRTQLFLQKYTVLKTAADETLLFQAIAGIIIIIIE